MAYIMQITKLVLHQPHRCLFDHRWSTAISAGAFLWLMFESLLFMSPLAFPITTQNFNYTPAAVVGILVVTVVAWLVSARRWFSGPRIDVDNFDAVRTKYWITDPPRTIRRG